MTNPEAERIRDNPHACNICGGPLSTVEQIDGDDVCGGCKREAMA